MKKLFALLLFTQVAFGAGETRFPKGTITSAGSFGTTSAPNSKSVVDMVSTTKGFLPPRMTQAQRDAISSPPAGLLIYNTDTAQLNRYDGATWGAVGGSGGGGLFSTGQNLLTNDSCNSDANNWTASGSSVFARTTSASHVIQPGTGVCSWDASASTETLTSNSVTITANDGLSNQPGTLSCFVKTTATDLKLEVYDGTNVISPNTATDVVPSSSDYVRYTVGFQYPASGTLSARWRAQSNSAILYFGQCYWGLAEGFNFAQVTQPSLYGTINWPTTSSCDWNWSAASQTWTSPSVDADCPTPTVTGNLSIASSSPNALPNFTMTNAPAGHYLIVASGGFGDNSASANAPQFRFTDGTNHTPGAMVWANGVASIMPSMTGDFTYTTAGTRTIGFQAAGDGASETARIYNTGSTSLKIRVYYFPAQASIAPRTDQMNWVVDANISGANIDSGDGAQTSYVGVENGSLTLTNRTGATIAAQIPCSSTNPPTGTTCSAGNESVGVSFTAPAGDVYACASFSSGNPGGGNGSAGTYQIVETAANSQTIIQEGGRRLYMAGRSNTTFDDASPMEVCGMFYSAHPSSNFANSGQKTLRLMYEKPATSTTSSIGIRVLADADASGGGQRDINWYVVPRNHLSAAISRFKGLVTSSSSGQERIERARISNSGTPAIVSQSGNWITSVSLGVTGRVNGVIASGVFSSTPTCVATSDSGNALIYSMVPAGMSATAFSIQSYNLSAAGTNDPFNLICMGSN